MITWIKKSWAWLVAATILAIAIIVWITSRKRSPWAAQKILEVQGDTEKQVERIEAKAASQQRKLDDAWRKKRKAIKQAEIQKLQKIQEEAKKLSTAALKRKLLEDLDEPL